MRRIQASSLSDDDKKDPNTGWAFIEGQVSATVKNKFRVHRLEFAHMRQKSDENITNFICKKEKKRLQSVTLKTKN